MNVRRWQWIFGLLFAGLMAFACCLPLFTMEGNWYKTHESDRYLEVAHHFREAFQAGFLYPRWFPNLYGGYGYPTFIYYQPGFFFTALPFSFLFTYPFQSMIWTIWFYFFLGGCGAFYLARRLTGSTWFGLFGTLLFLLTPYVECNVYVRGDLSEFAAMMLTPWPLYFLWSMRERVREGDKPGALNFLGLTITLAAVIVTHPATAMLYVGVLTVLTLAWRVNSDHVQTFYWWVGLGIVSALILSSPYWLTFWRMKGLIDLSQIHEGWYHPTRHLVNLKPLFNSEWRFGGSPWGMPLHLGLTHFLLAVAGGIVGRGLRFLKLALFIYLGLVIAMTYVGYPLWKFLPLLEYVQFPWRLLSVIAVLQVVCACGLARARVFQSGAWGPALLLFLGLCVVLSARNQFQFKHTLDIEPEQIITSSMPPFHDFQHLTAEDDYLPKTVKERPAHPRTDESMIHLQEGSEVNVQALPGHSPYHIKIGYQTGAEPVVVVMDQFGFPGMKVTLGRSSSSSMVVVPDLMDDGRMAVTLPADSQGILEAYYDGPPGWRVHLVVIFLWFVGLAGMAYYQRRHKNG